MASEPEPYHTAELLLLHRPITSAHTSSKEIL